ncbi:hypothetical protein ACHWQZ_G016325 [Mnemiopsis leidyi]
MGLSFEETVEHSPAFKNTLLRVENEIAGQETRLNRLLSLMVQREAQTKQIIETSRLINLEFEQLMIAANMPLKDTLKKYCAALQHWEESKERHNEQIRMVLIDPLIDFMQTDFKKVELRKQQYHTAVKEHQMCSAEYAECKQEDVARLHASSTTLFNANYNMTRLAARYVLQLKTFSDKRDIFLTSQLSELITTYLSHHQLGSNIALEVESQRDKLTETLVETKKSLEDRTNVLKEDLRQVVTRSERAQTMKLLNLQLYDLHMNEEATKTAARLNEYTNVEEMAPTSPPDQTRGYLWVGEKSPVFGYSWNRCWCRVVDGMLVIQNVDKGEQRVNLKLCQVKSDAYNINRAFCFTLFSPVKLLILQAQSSQERETWIMIMHKAIANAISKQDANFSIADDSNDKNPNQNSRKKDSIIPLSILRELQEIPGNLTCADCAKKKPTWASLNLGVLICIECSGIHRGLGVQLSQVRSLTLDALSSEQIDLLRSVGNAAANAIYEAELDAEKKLTNHAERKDFICRKYSDLTFTSSKYHDVIMESRKTGCQKTLAAVQTMSKREIPSPTKSGQNNNFPSPDVENKVPS